jgi:hypothetical protein
MATFFKNLLEEGENSWLSTESSEFQRNPVVKKPECDHPILADPEVKRPGMYGYYGDLYCPNCQEMFDFIFVEFEKRYPEFLSAWKEIIMREMDEDVVRCPRCGLRNLELV